jgi:hypothetical protein
MKILCEKCFGELETRTYEGLGSYVAPCPVCSDERDKEVAYAAGDCVLDFAKEHFSSIVKELYDSDGNVNLQGLTDLLDEIVAKKSGVEKDLDLINIREYLDI